MGQMGWRPLEFAEQDFFSFNWRPTEALPPRRLFGRMKVETAYTAEERAKEIETGGPLQQGYCMVHQFRDDHHDALYEQIAARHAQHAHGTLPVAASADGERVDKGRHLFGFHMQAHRNGAAVVHALQRIRWFHPSVPIFVVSDDCRAGGGLNYSSACSRFACTWTPSRGASGFGAGFSGGTRDETAHTGLQWLRRIRSSMASCRCAYMIIVEDDTCLVGPVAMSPPRGVVVGGLPWDPLPAAVDSLASTVAGSPPHQSGRKQDQRPVARCAGGCYLQSDFFLNGAVDALLRNQSVLAAAVAAGAQLWHMDMIAPIFALLAGGQVEAWSAAAEYRKRLARKSRYANPTVSKMKGVGGYPLSDKQGYLAGVAPENASMVHNCPELLALRAGANDWPQLWGSCQL